MTFLPDQDAIAERTSGVTAFVLRVQSVSETQGAAAMRVWLSILKVNPDVALPTCGVDADDGGEAYFGWNPGPKSLDISIGADGEIEWFYADHATRMLVSSEENPEDGYLGFVGLFRKSP